MADSGGAGQRRVAFGLAADVRELSFEEIDLVSGGGWFSTLMDAIQSLAGHMVQLVVDIAEWFFERFSVTYNSENDSVIVTSK